MAEQRQATSVADYKKIFSPEPKLVPLPSGAVFEIKQVDVVSFVVGNLLPIGFTEGNGGEKADVNEVMSKVDVVDLEKKLLVASVVNPPLSLEKKDGFLSLDELSPSDRAVLTVEVTKLHGLDRQSREGVKSFRKE